MRGRLLIALIAAVVSMTAAPAAAAPPEAVAMLSSWAPDTSAHSIVGGEQTITVVNHGTETAPKQILDLDPRPCACDREAVTIGAGTISGDRWVVPELEPGESASIMIRYRRSIDTEIQPAVRVSHEAPRVPSRMGRLGHLLVFMV